MKTLKLAKFPRGFFMRSATVAKIVCKFCDPECFHQLWLHQQKDNFVWIVGCGWCVVGGVCPSARQECKIITHLRAFLVDFLHSIADIS